MLSFVPCKTERHAVPMERHTALVALSLYRMFSMPKVALCHLDIHLSTSASCILPVLDEGLISNTTVDPSQSPQATSSATVVTSFLTEFPPDTTCTFPETLQYASGLLPRASQGHGSGLLRRSAGHLSMHNLTVLGNQHL